MKTDRPIPMMDRVHDWTYLKKFEGIPHKDATRRVAMQYRMRLRAAEKFTIDDEAVRLCCNLCHEVEQLDHWAILARLPYDTLWIEYSMIEKLREFERMGTLHGALIPETVSTRLGVLLYRDRQDTPAWIAHQFYEYEDGNIAPSPVAMLYDPEGEAHAPLRGSLTWRKPTLSLLPGFPPIPYEEPRQGSNQPRTGRVSPEAVLCGDLEPADIGVRARPWSIHRAAAIVEPWWEAHLANVPVEARLRLIANEVVEVAGALRWLVTFLATLNALPREIKEVTPRRGKRQSSGQMLPYFQHRTVTLTIPKKDRIVWAKGHMASSASHGRNAPRPWHRVSGHWRLAKYKMDRSGIQCQHEPELVENGLAICGKCQLLVRWVDSFHRGSAEVGMVEHRYKVTAKKPKPEKHP